MKDRDWKYSDYGFCGPVTELLAWLAARSYHVHKVQRWGRGPHGPGRTVTMVDTRDGWNRDASGKIFDFGSSFYPRVYEKAGRIMLLPFNKRGRYIGENSLEVAAELEAPYLASGSRGDLVYELVPQQGIYSYAASLGLLLGEREGCVPVKIVVVDVAQSKRRSPTQYTVPPGDVPKLGEDPLARQILALADKATELVFDSLHFPRAVPFGDSGPIIFLEDRDQMSAIIDRDDRFQSSDLQLALRKALSVTIVPYAAGSPLRRAGVGSAALHSPTLTARMNTGGAVIIATNNDRVGHWLSLARAHCTPATKIEFFDDTGVATVSEGGVYA